MLEVQGKICSGDGPALLGFPGETRDRKTLPFYFLFNI